MTGDRRAASMTCVLVCSLMRWIIICFAAAAGLTAILQRGSCRATNVRAGGQAKVAPSRPGMGDATSMRP